MIKDYDYLFKLVIVGETGVGKSCLLLRFADNQFYQNYLATIGVDFRFKTMNIDDKLIKFQIWDTAGQQRFRTITSAYYKGSQGVLVVYDITDRQSYENISRFWLNEIQMYAQKNVLVYLIGNKCDLTQSRMVQQKQVQQFTKKRNIKYFECSAKDDEKVTQIFLDFAREMIKLKGPIVSNVIKTELKQKVQIDNKKKKQKKNCC